MPEVNEYIPVEIVFESGLRLAGVGVVTAKRADGCYELLFPLSYAIMTPDGRPRNKWPKAEGEQALILPSEKYQNVDLRITAPLMPRRKKAYRDKGKQGT